MKKINSILEAAELFEKLAIYGDRKTFLKSLAQNNATNVTDFDTFQKEHGNYFNDPKRHSEISPPDQEEFGPSMVGGYSSAPSLTSPQSDIKYFPKSTPSKPVNLVPTRIDPKIQSMLNDVLVPLGKIFPLDVDGQFGEKTKKAYMEFQKAFGLNPTLENVSKAHDGIIKPIESIKSPGMPVAPTSNLSQISNTKEDSSESAGVEAYVHPPVVNPKK